MRIATAAVLLFVVGCHQYRPKTRYMEEEYVPYAQDGTCSISGRAFLTLPGGEVKPAANTTIYSVPVTTRSTEAFERGIVRDRPVEPDSEPMSETVKKCKRTVQADQEGKFSFEKLPPGNYYVYSQISYEVPRPSGDRSGMPVERIGVAYSKVTLSADEHKAITVTR